MTWLFVSFGVCLIAVGIVGYGAYARRPKSRWSALAHLLGGLLFFGGILNFLIYWHVSVYSGGNARSGKIENGKHYVASHGKFTEVSEEFWHYSYIHATSIWFTHPLGMVGVLLMVLADPKRRREPPVEVVPGSDPGIQSPLETGGSSGDAGRQRA